MTFVLVPGAGGAAWYWHRLVGELERRGHTAVAVELPAGDDDAGWAEYTDAVVAAAEGVPAPVVVGQSMGGFTAPLAAARLGARRIVLVNAMIPAAGRDRRGVVGSHRPGLGPSRAGRRPGARPG